MSTTGTVTRGRTTRKRCRAWLRTTGATRCPRSQCLQAHRCRDARKFTSRRRPAGIRTRYSHADTSTGADAARTPEQTREPPISTKGKLWSECQSHVTHHTCGALPACAPQPLCVTAPGEVGASLATDPAARSALPHARWPMPNPAMYNYTPNK